jgi:hypothetical protein
MKKLFTTAHYKARYNEADEIWDVYDNISRVAVIYEDSREIRFTDTSHQHHLSELTELRVLINLISRQYQLANE